jgi:hypothetical protein
MAEEISSFSLKFKVSNLLLMAGRLKETKRNRKCGDIERKAS